MFSYAGIWRNQKWRRLGDASLPMNLNCGFRTRTLRDDDSAPAFSILARSRYLGLTGTDLCAHIVGYRRTIYEPHPAAADGADRRGRNADARGLVGGCGPLGVWFDSVLLVSPTV